MIILVREIDVFPLDPSSEVLSVNKRVTPQE